jgi:hypothetical protein
MVRAPDAAARQTTPMPDYEAEQSFPANIEGDDCMSCGRSTAPGTRLFSARKRGKDTVAGDISWLCHACQEGSASVAPDMRVPVSGRYVVIELPGGGVPGGFPG